MQAYAHALIKVWVMTPLKQRIRAVAGHPWRHGALQNPSQSQASRQRWRRPQRRRATRPRGPRRQPRHGTARHRVHPPADAACLSHGLQAHPLSSSLRGLLAPAAKAQCMATARALLAMPAANPAATEAVAEFMHRVAGSDITRCPHCARGRWLTIGCQAPLPSRYNGGGLTGNGSSAGHSCQGSATCRGPP